MAKPEMRMILQQRDLEDETPKWRNVQTSEAFSAFTMTDYDGNAIEVVLETWRDRIRRTLTGDWP